MTVSSTIDLNVNEVMASLNSKGVAQIDKLVNGSALKQLQLEFDRVFDIIPDKAQAKMDHPSQLQITGTYSSGKHCRIQPPAYNNFPSLMNLFNRTHFKKIVDMYCGPGANFMMQTFMSHEYLMNETLDERSRLNWLHWDPYPSLKFFVYLTDVEGGCAATHYIPGSRSYGRKYRMKTSLTDLSGWQNGCRHRLEDWQSEPDFTNEDATPLYVKAGTVLIFDTDCLHFGSQPTSPGKERKVIITHNRPHNLQMPQHTETNLDQN